MRLVAAAAGVRILLLGLVAVGPAVWLPQQYDASPQLWPGSEASNICQRFAVWDAVHLLHVAQGGYSQEHVSVV